jgi:hypothetical protein
VTEDQFNNFSSSGQMEQVRAASTEHLLAKIAGSLVVDAEQIATKSKIKLTIEAPPIEFVPNIIAFVNSLLRRV